MTLPLSDLPAQNTERPHPDRRAPLVVIDLQTDMFSGATQPPLHDADGLLARAHAAIAWARRDGRPIAFIRHDGPPDDALAPEAPGWPIWPALGQAADEPTFSKNELDAFSNPAFAAWVAEQGAASVILLGAQTDYCVGATTRAGLALGLAVTVVGDAHSTWDSETEAAAAIIARHNAEFLDKGAAVITTARLTQSQDRR
ncbi:isochorismatase family protein [Acidisoma cellulosilytica]|uniref:Isochorismatase family protein n=1 Tax=Acidisoma cellulosilyticum TaxID=2802395 RepID=A0A963Z0A6_9PROT|nr:isochorismatase family protein [Acidisoma cellulosilyticum]MCB8879470.1 isochorismatase family protein [Acidisoma cellulosilyticum]